MRTFDKSYDRPPLTPQQQRNVEAFGTYLHGIADNPNVFDIQAGRIYDTITARSAGTLIPTRHQLFVIPMGYHGRSESDTNMHQVGQLPCPELASLERLVISFSSRCSDDDVYGFAENFNFIFWQGKRQRINCPIISMRPFDQCKAPIKTCLYCRGVYIGMRCNSCGASEANLLTINGEVQQLGRQFMYEMDPRVVICQQQPFHGELGGDNFYTRDDNFKVWFTFEGLRSYGVQ